MSQPSLRKNYIYKLLYEILAMIAPLITAPYVSRVLGADGVGIYSYTSSIMTFFTMFAALGTASYGTREIARHRDNKAESSKLFFEIELLSVITSSICIVIWIFLIVLSEEYRYYFMALLPLLFGTMLDISWYFTGLEQVGYIVLRNTACKIVGIVLLFLLVKDKDDLLLYMIMQSLISVAGNLSMWTYLPRLLAKVDFHDLHLKTHFRETLIYFVPTIASSVYTVLDKTLIGLITKDNYQNGYYEQTTKIINMAKSVVFVSVNSVMSARISYLYAKNSFEEIRHRIGRTIDYIFFLGYASVFGIIGVAKTFVPVFYGDGYEPVIELLYMMSPIVLIIGVSNCLGSNYYTPAGLRTKSSKYIITGSCVNLILNLCLIPFWGAKGAAFASVMAETVITVLYMVNCNGYMTVKDLWHYSWKRLLSACLMLFAVLAFAEFTSFSDIITLLLQIVIGACIYLVLLLLLRDGLFIELLETVLQFLKKIFGKKNGLRG